LEVKIIFVEVIKEKLSKEKEKFNGYTERAVKSKEKSEHANVMILNA